MRCHICNKIVAVPEWDEVRNEWAPCPKCKGEAASALEDYSRPHALADLFDWEGGEEPLPPEEGLGDYYKPL